MFDYLKEDIRRYFAHSELSAGVNCLQLTVKLLRTPALWVIALFRFRTWVGERLPGSLIGLILRIPHFLLNGPLSMMFGIHIDSKATIGKGFYVGHYGSIWIGPIKMGSYCNISQEVTIGMGGRGDDQGGLPTLGDRVYVAPGAKVFGCISIGDDVAIGANAVVSKSLPDKAVAVGNPARIVSREGSAGLIFV